MNTEMIYPELGEKTNAQIEYKCSYNGGFYLTTKLELKGRGIKQSGKGSTHARGMNTYFATENALNKLKTQYTSCFIASL